MGNAFGTGNTIFVHTDRPGYVAGDLVQGTAYLNIISPVNSRGVFIKVTGAESSWWRERHTRTVQRGDQSETEEYYVVRSGRCEFFKARLPLFTFQGAIQPGQYAFPFCFQLPVGLPGVYAESGNRWNIHYHCEVKYKLKAECHVHGMLKPNIKHTQRMIVFEKVMSTIQPQYMERTANVNVCCCIKKGTARMVVHTDKNCYVPGETANVVCEVDNQSTVPFRLLKCRLMRTLSMRDAYGHTFRETEIVAESDYPGVPAMTSCLASAARYLPLRLQHTQFGVIQPETHGRLVTCEYYFEVAADVSMGFDMKTRLPVTIYAAQPVAEQWQVPAPSGWNPQAMPMVTLQLPAVGQSVAALSKAPAAFAGLSGSYGTV